MISIAKHASVIDVSTTPFWTRLLEQCCVSRIDHERKVAGPISLITGYFTCLSIIIIGIIALAAVYPAFWAVLLVVDTEEIVGLFRGWEFPMHFRPVRAGPVDVNNGEIY